VQGVSQGMVCSGRVVRRGRAEAAMRRAQVSSASGPRAAKERRSTRRAPPVAAPLRTLLLGEQEAAVQKGRLGVVHQQQHAHVGVLVKVGVHLTGAHHACDAAVREAVRRGADEQKLMEGSTAQHKRRPLAAEP
jgi:hypothetical protein